MTPPDVPSDDDLFADEPKQPVFDEADWSRRVREAIDTGHMNLERDLPTQEDVLRNWARFTVVMPELDREIAIAKQRAVMLEENAGEMLRAALIEADRERRANGNGKGGGEACLVAHTVAELRERRPEIAEWICYPYIAEGDVVSFESPPKDGKTTFVLGLVHAVSAGSVFLGEKTCGGPVLYCTEERVGTFLGALDRTGNHDGAPIHVVLIHEHAWNMKWPEAAAEIARLAAQVKAKLVVIDTLSKWAGLIGDDEFSAGVAMGVMTPLQHLASCGCAVAVIRHERKAGGAVGQAGRGSTAWTGEMDAVIAVRRIAGEKTQRLIAAVGRHDETPEERIVDFSGSEYQMLGDPVDLRRLDEERQVIDSLNYGEAGALPINELRGEMSRRTAERILGRLIREGIVQHGLGASQRGGRPRVYWLKGDDD
jgi:hypothetical protein